MESSPTPPAPHEFHALPFPVRSFATQHAGRYRVYTDLHHFVTVEAETAAEALKASKVETPLFIKRDMPEQQTIIDIKRMLE